MNLRLLLPGLRRLQEKPFRGLMLALGIAFGSFLFATTRIINQTADLTLKDGMEAISGRADLVISRSESGFPEDTLEKVLGLEHVQSAVPLVMSRAIYSSTRGERESLIVFGVDFFTESEVRSYGADKPRLIKDPFEFIAQKDSIAISQVFAKTNGLGLESPLTLMTGRGPRQFKVRAILGDSEQTKTHGAGFVVMDIEAARMAFGKEGRTDRIDVRLSSEAKPEAVAQEIKTSLGESFDVDVASEQVDLFRKSITTFRHLTNSASYLSFFVAFILVVLTVTRSVLERAPEIGVLRSLGATKGQIFSTLVLEIIVTSFIGSISGVLASALLADRLGSAAQHTISSQANIQLTLAAVQWDAADLVKFMTVGVLVAVLGALAPLIYVSRLSVLSLMRKGVTEQAEAKNLRWPLVTGLVLASIVAGLRLMGWDNATQTLLVFFASLFLGPFFVLQLLRLLERLLINYASSSLKLALSFCARGSKSTQLIVIGLIFGTMILTTLSVVSSSFFKAVDARLTQAAAPDIYVISHGNLTANQVQPIDYSLKSEITKIEGAEGTFAQRATKITYRGRTLNVRAVEEIPPINFSVPYSYLNVVDRPVSEAGKELYHGSGLPVMVNETFVTLFKLKTGDELTLDTYQGRVKAKIVGVVSDLFGGGGSLFLSYDKYREYWGDPLVTGFGVFLKPGSNLEEVRSRISRRFSDVGLVASTRDEIRSQGHATIQKGFAYLRVIEWVLASVAFLGFVNAFLIEVLSRQHIIATVRSLGMTSGELMWAISMEGFLIGTIGTVVSIFLGCVVSAHFLSFALGPQFGWIIQMSTDWRDLASLAAMMIGAVSVLSLYPAFKASQQEIKDALVAS